MLINDVEPEKFSYLNFLPCSIICWSRFYLKLLPILKLICASFGALA